MDQSKASKVWKNPCLKTLRDQLYDDRDTTGDVTFIVQSERIKAHRCILAALSLKYKTQFYGSMPEVRIEVKNVSSAVFKEFLQFFYKEEVTLTLNNIEGVFYLAQYSLVDGLMAECLKFFINKNRIDMMCMCYRMINSHQIWGLKTLCEEKISQNILKVFATKDFVECDRDVLTSILKLDSLNCNETELFGACIAWTKAACKRKGVDDSKVNNLRNELGGAIFEIRFCTMSIN